MIVFNLLRVNTLQVIKDRRWKEVTGAFNFPSTITSASFVLRRYYLSLLYHFEQVYYFRKEEPSISSNGTSILYIFLCGFKFSHTAELLISLS